MSSRVLRIAIVAYQGVLADESAAFRDVLGRVPGARLTTVGPEVGDVAGPGGVQVVDATFDDLDDVDVVVVPGGLGSHRHPEIADWIRRLRPRWVLTSSTGSALLAASGLLRGRRATTHWLAGPLLERHGVLATTERLVVDGRFVTCAGLASTFDAADVVVREIGGNALVRAIHDELRTSAGEDERPPCPPARTRYRSRPAATRPPRGERRQPTSDHVVEIELEEHPPRPRHGRAK